MGVSASAPQLPMGDTHFGLADHPWRVTSVLQLVLADMLHVVTQMFTLQEPQ